ncbi:MAG TPA: hypothetical protein VFU46_03875 [Gemmatimonadales bacterium]|nr:hypothetical protein [Gemmatimonadales bacterium]
MPNTARPSASHRGAGRLPPGISGQIKGWLNLDGRFFLGPRYVTLLEGIDATGTIRDGCRRTQMSYRTCLNRIRQMERALGRPLVVTARGGAAGGRAELTAEARRLVRLYRGWRDRMEQETRRAFAAARRDLAGSRHRARSR